MAYNPEFPNWKHFLAMTGIYIAGMIGAATPIAFIAVFTLAGQGAEFDPTNMSDPESIIDPQWISHLAPFMHSAPILLCILYGWPRLGKPKWDLGFKHVGLMPAVLSILGTLLIANGTTMVAEYLPGYESFVESMQELMIPGVGMAITIVIFAPVFEEALLRGIVLRGLLRKTTPFWSIVISGLLFGIMHGIPIQVFFATIVGFSLGYVYYRTRSLGLVILIHFINNGASYLLGQTDMPTTTEELIGTGMPGVLALAAGLTFAGLGMLYLLGEKYPLVPPPADDYAPRDVTEPPLMADA